MSVRAPRFLAPLSLGPGRTGRADALAAFEHEAMAEMAVTLSDVTRRFETALAAVKAAEGLDAAAREPLLDAAARALFALQVQREVLRLRGTERLIRDYGVPAAVIARVGVVR